MDRKKTIQNIAIVFVNLAILAIILSHFMVVPAIAKVGDGGTLTATVRDDKYKQTITATDPDGVRKMEIYKYGSIGPDWVTTGNRITLGRVEDREYPLKVKVFDCQGPPNKEINEFLGITAAGGKFAAPNSEIGVPTTQSGCGGGGISESPDRFALLAPYIGIISAFMIVAGTFYIRRIKRGRPD